MPEPIIGWRTWEFSNYKLYSCNHITPWLFNDPLESDKLPNFDYCVDDAGRINTHIQYGIHAYKNFDDLITHRSMEIWNDDKIVIGQVYMWGKIIEHKNGYRSQYAYPKNLMFWNFYNLEKAENYGFRNHYGCEIIQSFEELNQLAPDIKTKMIKLDDGRKIRSFVEFKDVDGDSDLEGMPTIKYIRIENGTRSNQSV